MALPGESYSIVVAGLSEGQARALYCSLIGVGVEDLYGEGPHPCFTGRARAFWESSRPVTVDLRPTDDLMPLAKALST